MLGEPVGSIVYVSASSNGYLISSTNTTLNVTYPHQTRVFHVHLISSATPSNVTISNGQNGKVLININGTANKGIDFDFGWWGITFSLGAYITFDGNQADCVVTCKGDGSALGAVGSGGGGGVVPAGVLQDNSGNYIQDDVGNYLIGG